METYDVPFEIKGHVTRVRANSPEEAKAKVDAEYSVERLARLGDLQTFNGERSAFRSIYLEALKESING